MSNATKEAREKRHHKFRDYADAKKTQGDKPQNMTAACPAEMSAAPSPIA